MARAATQEPATEEQELDFTVYRDKPATRVQEAFADWLIDNVGVEFGTKKEEQAWRDGVRLGASMRMHFQRSPENQQDLEERRKAAEALKAERANGTGRRGRKAAEEAPEEPAEEVPAARRGAGRRAAPPAKAAKTAKAPARRAEAAEEPAEEEAPARPARRGPARRRTAAPAAASAEAPF
jgi:hypothetical protein